MELSDLLILLFVLAPLLERFLNKRKQQAPGNRPVEPAPEPASKPDLNVDWDKALKELEVLLGGQPEPAQVPAPAPPPMPRLEQKPFETVRTEHKKPEFRSHRHESSFAFHKPVDHAPVEPEAEAHPEPIQLKVDAAAIRSTVVLNEILLPPVSKRPKGFLHRR